jgi:excinuclease UvrABC nuclease subunit
MTVLMKQLLNSPLIHWSKLGDLPTKGIYVFYESGKPIYVGRTNRMNIRIKEHGRLSSNHNQAPFAFNIAKSEAINIGINVNMTRKELELNLSFKNLYQQAKKRVSNMYLRVVEVNNPIIQTLFEVYVSMELKTGEYNNFDNH